MKHHQNITLAYCWGDDAGGKAITPGTLKLLHENFQGAQITVISIFSDEHPGFHESASYIKEKYPNVTFVPNPLFHFSIPVRYVNWGLNFPFFFFSLRFPRILSSILSKNQGLNALVKADLVIHNGGHLFFWNKRMGEKLGNLLHAYPLLIAKRLKIPYGLYAQSFGPFEFGYFDRIIKLFYRWLFSGSLFIYTRESKSQSEIGGLIDKSKCDLATVLDSAFFLKGEDDQKAKDVLDKYNLIPNSFIAMTIRLTKRGSSKLLEKDQYSRYGRELSRFIAQWIEEKKIPVAIVCHVPSDIKDSRFVYEHLPDKYKDHCKVIIDPLSPEALKSLYKNARILIGMRFHSLVFALSVNTPVLGLYYYDIGPKIEGMLGDLGFNSYTFSMDGVSVEELFERVNEVDQNRDKVSKDIELKLTGMKKHSLDVMKEIRERCV